MVKRVWMKCSRVSIVNHKIMSHHQEWSFLVTWSVMQKHLSWDITAMRDHLSSKTIYSWQDLHFSVIYLSTETACLKKRLHFYSPLGDLSRQDSLRFTVVKCLGLLTLLPELCDLSYRRPNMIEWTMVANIIWNMYACIIFWKHIVLSSFWDLLILLGLWILIC